MINKYSIINEAKCFSSNGLQNYVVFQPNNGFFKYIDNNSSEIESMESKGMSKKSIKDSHTSDITFSPELIDKFDRFGRLKFKGICLKHDSVSFKHKKLVNVYILYILNTWSKDLNTDFTPGNWLFGAVKLTKNADPDKYKYSGNHIGFDSRSQFSWSDGSNGKSVIIFGVDKSSSVHIVGRKKNMLVLGEGTTQDLDNGTIAAEAK